MKPLNKKKILLIFAHPDDETFSCSGTIIKYAREGAAISLICATRGEAGELGEPPVCLPEELGEQRTEETRCAGKMEGIKKLYFLGMRDGTLEKFSTRFLSNLLLPIITRIEPDLIITFADNGISGHDDHIAISKAATLSFRKYLQETKNKCRLYHVTLSESIVKRMREKGMVRDIFKRPFKGTPDEKITLQVDIKDVLPEKIKALQCHKSQHRDWERFISRIKEGLNDYEYFVEYKI